MMEPACRKSIPLQVILMSVLTSVASSLQTVNQLRIPTHEFFQHELLRSSYFDEFSLDADEQVVFHPSLVAHPGLPGWLQFTQDGPVHPGYLYGTPTDIGTYDMEIFGDNLNTFETSRVLLRIEVDSSENVTFPQHHVSLVIRNHNIEDMLNTSTQGALVREFTPLWGHGATVSIYGMESEAQLGLRNPIPSDDGQKHAVQVTLSSTESPTENFRRMVEEVDCGGGGADPVPPVAAELQSTFKVAWCMVTFTTITGTTITESADQPVYLGGEFIAPVRTMEQTSDFLGFLLVVVLPSVFLLAVVTLLCCMMFMHRQGIEKRNYQTAGIQLAHHSMIRQASQELRSLSNRRDGGPTPIGTPQQVATPNLRGRRTPTRTVLPHQTPPPPYRLPPDARNQQETSFSNKRENRRSSEPSQSRGLQLSLPASSSPDIVI